MYRGNSIRIISVVSVLALALAGCGSQTGLFKPTLSDAIIPGPLDLTGYAECPPLAQPVTSGPGFFDNDDGFATLQKGPLQLDQAGCGSNATDLDTAENWTYDGKADQYVRIRILAYAYADPQLTLIDPNGDAIDVGDNGGSGDSGGGSQSSQIDDYLPMDGVYTLRVAMFSPGRYMISVQTGTPEPD